MIFLLRLLPRWDYVCPKCRTRVKKKRRHCPNCGAKFKKPERVPSAYLKGESALKNAVAELPTSDFQKQLALDPTLTLRPNADGDYSAWTEWRSAEIHADQFESGDFSAWTGTQVSGTTISVATDAKHHGLYAQKITGLGAVGDYGNAYKDITAAAIVYMRVSVRFSAPWDGNNAYRHTGISFRGTTNDVASAILKWDGTGYKWGIEIYTSAWQYYYETGYSTVQANTWYIVELYLKVAASPNGETSLWVDGTLKVQKTGLVTNNRGNVTRVRTEFSVDNVAEGSDKTVWLDCAVVRTSYIGVENRASLANDQSDNTGLKVISSTTLKEALNLEDTSQTGTINSVTAYMRAKATGSDPAEEAKIIWRTYSTDYESSAITISRTAFTDYSEQRTVNPNTGAAWTWAEVNALQIGVRASTLASGETVMVSDLWIVVDYTTVILKEVTDSLSLSDTTLTNKTFAVSDSVGLSDALPSTGRTLPITDLISLLDQALTDKSFNLSDQVLLSDAIQRDQTLIVTDSVGLSELVEKWVAGAVKTKIFLIIGDIAIQLTGGE